MKVQQSLFLVSVGVALAMACGGTTVNPPDLGDGGGSSGGSGSSGGAGGSCTTCTVDQDCVRGCGATPMPNYNWCCGAGTCYTFSTTCPPSSSGGSGGGSGSGSSGGSTGGGSGGGSGSGSSGGVSLGGATPGTGPIPCGMAGMCMPPNVCCVGGGGGDTCTNAAMCALSGNDVYTCTGKANCPGGACCATPGRNGMPDIAACRTTCTGGGTRRYQVCQSSAECPMGQTCGMGQAVALNVCQ
jgi:hypothetical protein